MKTRLIVSLFIVFGHAMSAEAQGLPPLSEILKGMKAHEAAQESILVEYQARRRFHAENERFNMKSTLEVRTVFKRPDLVSSEVLRSEGSALIREKVFDKILEAEQETQTPASREQMRITPDNYKFQVVALADCSGRPCYQLTITPRRKDKFSIQGQIWVDSEDGAIVRLTGSPAKRPSFWTQRVDIIREYVRIEGVWLCRKMESTSDIFLGGKSTLEVDYSYQSIRTEHP